MSRHLFPCPACGKTFPVESSRAGASVACPHCAAETQLPRMMELKKLPLDEDQKPRKAGGYSAVRGTIFVVGAVLLLVGLGVAGAVKLRRDQIDTSFTTESDVEWGNTAIESMTLSQTWSAWKAFTDGGIGPKMRLIYLEQLKTARMLTTIMWAGLWTGGVGLLLMLGSMIGSRG